MRLGAPHPNHPETSIFLSKTRFRGGGGSSNDHAKLKSENGFVKQNRRLMRNVVSNFLCERRNTPDSKIDSSESGPKTLNSLDFEGNVQSF